MSPRRRCAGKSLPASPTSNGLLYFCYWSPAGVTFQWGNAIMTPRGGGEYVEGPKFALVQRVNAKLGAFGAYLLNASSRFVFAANGTSSSNTTVVPTAAIAVIGGSGVGAAWSVLLGGFAPAGAPAGAAASAFVLLNSDTMLPAVLSLALSADAGVACELDAAGARGPLYDDATAMPGLQLYLGEGDARLLFFVAEGASCSP